MPICPNCKQDLSDLEFYKPATRKIMHGNDKSGSKTQAVVYCRKCHNERMAKRFQEGIDDDTRKKIIKSQRFKDQVRNSQQRLRMEIITHYGGNPPKCACCNESNIGFLTLDHINNDGAQDRKLHGYGPVLNMWIIKNNFPEGYQVLCYNCNCGKARNKRVCPHKGNIVAQKTITTCPSLYRNT